MKTHDSTMLPILHLFKDKNYVFKNLSVSKSLTFQS